MQGVLFTSHLPNGTIATGQRSRTGYMTFVR
jgi:hypothetical protein